MAEIVVGIASSHTPQLSSGVDMWPDHAERDRRNPQLLGRDAEFHSYDELLANAPPGIGHELEPAVWEDKYRRCQDAIAVLSERLAKAQPDVAVVIGDDQRELFRDDGIPAFACFAGSELADFPPSAQARGRMPKGIRAASWAAHADHEERHLVCADLSWHLAEQLTAADFDITLLTEQPAGRSLGHAFTFPRYRLGLPAATPIVPVFINTYYPPNVPSAARCHALGQAIRAAIASWSGGRGSDRGSGSDRSGGSGSDRSGGSGSDRSGGSGSDRSGGTARVAVIASGGLSHFVVDEDLDQHVLAAITGRDSAALRSLPRAQLRSGTSEILNWVCAAGALEGLNAAVADYVAGYRSPAGTGAGMAFVQWE